MFAALQLIESFRAKGEPLTGGVFRVCWDAALDCGAKLRVTSNRTVNVRKGNRPERSLFGFDQSYSLWSGNETAPTGPLTLRAIEQALGSIAEQDRADAAALAAAINAPPRLMTIEQAEPQFFGIDPGAETPATTIVYSAARDSGLWTEYDSDRIFREIGNEGPDVITLTSAQAFARYGAGELRQWSTGDVVGGGVARVVHVDPARRTITLAATTRTTPAMYLRRVAKRAPDPRAKPSRVPERLQKTRLDGRRSR
jgi:hypothetical protein